MIFDYADKEPKASRFGTAYARAAVFPHIVLDGFLNLSALDEGLAEFPPISGEGWIHYQHFNENKGGLNKRGAIPPKLLAIIDELNSARFVSWLSTVTGIPNLLPDPALEGGGLHQIKRGGFLNVHADFTVHPHKRMWRRRVNVLVYLNKDWQDAYGGKLELWTKDMKQAFEEVVPLFNRCVIFNTDADSFHGHPHPLACPENMTRKSIALYYFTEEAEAPRKQATNYRARPADGAKAVLIWLDKQALAVYNRLKGIFGINDDFVSRILKVVGRLRGK